MLNIKIKNQAFSLIEVIVALGIFAILASGIFNVATSSYRNFYGTGDKQSIAEFAQEGIEVARSIRDNSWQDIEDVDVAGAKGVAKASGGYWEFNGSSNIQGALSRTIVVSTVERDSNDEIVASGGTEDPNTKKVVVTVSGSGIDDYVLTTYLTNWSYKTWEQSDWSGVGDREFWADNTLSSSSVSNLNTSTVGNLLLDSSVYTNGYVGRKTITMDNTKVSGIVDFTNFPIYFSDTLDYLKTSSNGGSVTNDDGYDIIFTSDSDGLVLLDYEIEKYASTTGQLEAWIEIPTLSYKYDTTIYMFYSSSTVATSQENVTGIWDTGYAMVYHLGEPSGTTGAGSVIDSTGNTSGTPTTGLVFDSVGKTGPAIDFSSGTGISTAAIGDPILTPTTTISFWIYADDYTTPSRQNPFEQAYGGWGTMTLETSGRMSWYIGDNGGNGSNYANYYANSIITNDTWIYVAVVRSPLGYSYKWYKNGAYHSGGIYSSTFPVIDTRTFKIGDGYVYPLNGLMDEFRVTNDVRSEDWIATEYNNQNATSTFYTLSGSSEYYSSGNLYSSIFDIGSTDKEIKSLIVEQDVPSGCDLDITLELSDDASFTSGVLSQVFSDTSVSSYVSSTSASLNGKRYIRYKVDFTSCNSSTETPTLYSVSFDYR